MPQPTGNDPVWCTTPDGTHLNVEPSAGQKATGWEVDQIPPSSYFNWWQNKVGQWVVYLKGLAGEAFTWTGAHIFQARVTANDGVIAAPDGLGNPALEGVGGADGVGVVGSSNFTGVYGEGNTGTDATGVEGVGGDVAGTGVKGTGGAANGTGVTGIGGASHGKGGEFTGDGTGSGVKGTGGDSSGVGVEGVGGSAHGKGVKGTGSGSGEGGIFTGGTNGNGVQGTGGSGGASGGAFTGTATAPGVQGIGGSGGAPGGAFSRSDGSVRLPAIDCNGTLNMNGGLAPSLGTTPVLNELTVKNMIKGWAMCSYNDTANPTVSDSFNVTSVTRTGGAQITVTWAQDFATGFYLVLRDTFGVAGELTGASGPRNVAMQLVSQSAGVAVLEFYKMTDSSTFAEADIDEMRFYVIAVGLQ